MRPDLPPSKAASGVSARRNDHSPPAIRPSPCRAPGVDVPTMRTRLSRLSALWADVKKSIQNRQN